jgi:hypothetical protein
MKDVDSNRAEIGWRRYQNQALPDTAGPFAASIRNIKPRVLCAGEKQIIAVYVQPEGRLR